MNSWDKFLLIVWRCTIGPVLFCLLLICAIASFFIGGSQYFHGCWKMAKFSMSVDCDRSSVNFPTRVDSFGGGTTNIVSRFLWTVLFGIWLRILFMLLMAATHLLLLSDRLSEAMLELAECARNPYDIYVPSGAVGALHTDYSDTNAGETNPTSDFNQTPTPSEAHPCYVEWDRSRVDIYDKNGRCIGYVGHKFINDPIENAVVQGDCIVVTTEQHVEVYRYQRDGNWSAGYSCVSFKSRPPG